MSPSVPQQVKMIIDQAGPGRFWSRADFPGLSTGAVARALARLHASGRLRRYGRGLFYEPRMTLIGEAPPSKKTSLCCLPMELGS